MKSFFRAFLKFLLIPLIVLILVILGYFIFDPYKVLYKYETYSHSIANRDYYGIENFKEKYPKYKYDSFLFGSSRTLAFKPSSWKQYLDEDSSPYTFDAFGDNIYGIYHKIKYLDSLSIPLSNALILLDVGHTFLSEKPEDQIVTMRKHPDIDGSDKSEFYGDFFYSYLRPNLIASFYLHKFFGLENQYVYTYIGDIKSSVDSVTNELRRDDLEELIKTDNNYFNNVLFNERSGVELRDTALVTPKHIEWLEEIKSIFDKNNTEYKIIIGPTYNQHIMAQYDLDILYKIFGTNNVFDFSGVNEFTNSKENYYEMSHYRPFVGDSILKIIYAKD